MKSSMNLLARLQHGMRSPRYLIVLLLVLAVACSLLVFQLSFSGELPKLAEAINSSFLGAILASIITFLLLKFQSEAQEVREKNTKVFERKSESFQIFINLLWDRWSDSTKKITQKQFEDMLSSFYRNVYMYLNKENLEAISKHLDVLSTPNGQDFEAIEARNAIFSIIGVLKKEIGLPYFEDAGLLESVYQAFDKAKDISEKRDIESRVTTDAQGSITFWHFIMLDDTWQRDILQKKQVLVLGDGEGDSSRTRLLESVKSGDVIFLYSRGSDYVGVFMATGSGVTLPKQSPDRVYMRPDDGLEGQLPVKELLLFAREKRVERDVLRRKTIQRILDVQAIRKLAAGFRDKAHAEGIQMPIEFSKICDKLLDGANTPTTQNESR